MKRLDITSPDCRLYFLRLSCFALQISPCNLDHHLALLIALFTLYIMLTMGIYSVPAI